MTDLQKISPVLSGHIGHTTDLPLAPKQGIVVKTRHLIEMNGLDCHDATLRRLATALTAKFPLGANVIARSSSTGGFSFSLPAHVAPRDAAAFAGLRPLSLHRRRISRMVIARLAELPHPKSPTRSQCSTPATRKLRRPMMPAHSRGATWTSSKPAGNGKMKSVRTRAYSVKPPSIVYPQT